MLIKLMKTQAFSLMHKSISRTIDKQTTNKQISVWEIVRVREVENELTFKITNFS